MAYSGWLLPEQERDRLLAILPATFPDVIAHHITAELGDYDTLSMPAEITAVIVGVALDGEGVEAMVVEVNGTTERPIGGTYHITWSLDRAAGFKPVDSNKVIAAQGYSRITPILIRVKPQIFR